MSSLPPGWATDLAVLGHRTEATNAAGRVYRSLGFEPDGAKAQVYRPHA